MDHEGVTAPEDSVARNASPVLIAERRAGVVFFQTGSVAEAVRIFRRGCGSLQGDLQRLEPLKRDPIIASCAVDDEWTCHRERHRSEKQATEQCKPNGPLASSRY